jgi:hypothetical protein
VLPPALESPEDCEYVDDPIKLWDILAAEVNRHMIGEEERGEARDWSTWISANLDEWIGQGSYGDVFGGTWRSVPRSVEKLPKVVIKRMKCDQLSEKVAMRRYRVRQPTSRNRRWVLKHRI